MTRTELVVLFLVLFLLAMAGLWLGWRNRAKQHADLPPLATPPAELGEDLVPPLTGLYVGTTVSTQWQNRVVVHTLGERADACTRLTSHGVLIERQGSGAVFIPATSLIDARLEPALAGKVVGRGGLLVLRWQHGSAQFDTGLRADEKTQYPDWISAVAALVSGASGVASHPENSDGLSNTGRGDIGDE